MADKLMLAGARTARFERPTTEALELVGHSPAITRVQELVRRAAPLDTGVLLTAERGAGVDSVARELHRRSRRAAAPYIAVECDAADPSRLAQLLFGTGPQIGQTDLESISRGSRIAAARGGTLFLQDVTDCPPPSRLVSHASRATARCPSMARRWPPTCGSSPAPRRPSTPRSTTHRLRSDLFRRLAVVRIDLPPLRDRLEDVPALAARVLEEVLAERGLKPRAFTQAALALVAAVTWPGNLSELQAAMARAAGEPGDHDIQVEHLLPALHFQHASARFVPTGNLREARLRFERDYISAVLQHHGWRMADAAQTLGIQRPNLYRKARQLGIPVTRVSE